MLLAESRYGVIFSRIAGCSLTDKDLEVVDMIFFQLYLIFLIVGPFALATFALFLLGYKLSNLSVFRKTKVEAIVGAELLLIVGYIALLCFTSLKNCAIVIPFVASGLPAGIASAKLRQR